MSFDPYRRWLKIPRDRRPPTYYDLLGLARDETDDRRIHVAAQDRYDHVRKYTLGPAGPERDAAHRVLGELSEALYCLTNPERRQEYDRRLGGGLTATAAPGAEAGPDPFEALHSLLDEEMKQAPAPGAPPAQLASKQCPDCQSWLIPGAVLCVRCGTDLRTGEKLSTVVTEQEEEPPDFGELLAAAWSSLSSAFRHPEDGRGSRHRPKSDVVARASSALAIAIVIGVMLLVAAALYPFVSRLVAHYQMNKIVQELHFTMTKDTNAGGKPAIGVEGNIPIAAGKFARYLRHFPSYLAKVQEQEGKAANKKRSYLQQIILKLPPGTNLKPLRKIPQDSFAYNVAQEVLAREEAEGP